MSDELIGQDRGIGRYVNKVDGERGDFSEHSAAKRVGEGEGGGLEDEVDSVLLSLWRDY